MGIHETILANVQGTVAESSKQAPVHLGIQLSCAIGRTKNSTVQVLGSPFMWNEMGEMKIHVVSLKNRKVAHLHNNVIHGVVFFFKTLVEFNGRLTVRCKVIIIQLLAFAFLATVGAFFCFVAVAVAMELATEEKVRKKKQGQSQATQNNFALVCTRSGHLLSSDVLLTFVPAEWSK